MFALELPSSPRGAAEPPRVAGLVSAGFTTTLPSGSEQKGLGGELALEPFAIAAIAIGPFDLIGEVSYKWTFKPEHAQEFDSGLAAAWPVSRWFTPFVEFRTTTPTVAEDHRTQVTLVPGLNVKPFARSTLAVGVQLPVTSAQEFDYQVRVLFIKDRCECCSSKSSEGALAAAQRPLSQTYWPWRILSTTARMRR